MKNGFTLIELSIVLVIVGLLIGGILVGQSLIESTENQGIIRVATQYKIMMKHFQERNRCLPGDCLKPFIPLSLRSSNAGNNLILDGWESGLVMPHLQLLGIYESGKPISSFEDICKSYNSYTRDCFIQGPHNGSIFTVRHVKYPYDGTGNTRGSFSYGPNRMLDINLNEHWLTYGKWMGNGAAAMSPLEIMPPAQALAIDRKVDDGSPATGSIRGNARDRSDGGRGLAYTACLTAYNYTPGVRYDVSKTAVGCNLYFYIGSAANIDDNLW